MSDSTNREAWLTKAAELMRVYFPQEVPAFRVSVGWPGGKGKKGNVIGQAWRASAADDNMAQVFISPSIVEPIEVLATLLHEMVHVVDNNENGHRKPFADIARKVGLKGPWTSTTASETLVPKLNAVVLKLGEYPHAALNKIENETSSHTQTTRMLKAECVNETGYKVRLSRKWLEEYGAPKCACCDEPMETE